jgi:hypothetical protein
MPNIALTRARVVVDTDEDASDEPYVIVCCVDVSRRVGGLVVPSVWTRLVGPWASADQGDLLVTTPLLPPSLPPKIWRMPFWDINGQVRAIEDPDEVIFLVAMMEHDDSATAMMRQAVNGAVTGTAAGTVNNLALDRDGIVRELRAAMRDAIDGVRQIPVINTDERLGGVQELRLTSDHLERSAEGEEVRLNLTFNGDGGSYRLEFIMRERSLITA